MDAKVAGSVSPAIGWGARPPWTPSLGFDLQRVVVLVHQGSVLGFLVGVERYGNRPFNDFWLALAAAFGVNLSTLGVAKQFTGPLAGVFG